MHRPAVPMDIVDAWVSHQEECPHYIRRMMIKDMKLFEFADTDNEDDK